MADLLPKRTNTSSTIDTEQTARESEEVLPKQPITPTRTRVAGRRLTLSHRKLVFCDPVAFRYLEEDESTIVLARREKLQGYELYLVEQWVCSRVHPTFVITTYTGDPSHSIFVNVLSVPIDEKTWSKRLKIYLDAVSQFHAREQETRLGALMVTNLSAFPSALTVISVPDGDVRKHREDFIVNENLKRMGCSGRAAMNLQPAPSSTVAKFHHLYQTNESIAFKSSVMELVRLCQTALVLYGKLESIYADGLLCDITEKAVQDWWNDIGTDFHNVEPSDGPLGPTTVSALIGLMVGAYNRLRATGVNVPKDVLDVMSMKRAIGHFQKAYKLNKTRRLDRDTLNRLHRATAKTAQSEGWAVPRTVKSTVAELSGKGGEMVMGAIGANKEKIGISEIETLEIDKLAQLVPGEKMRWLWQGKPLKSSRGDVLGRVGDDGLNGRVFATDDQGNYLWTSGARDSPAENDDGDESGGHVKSRVKRRLRGAVGIPGLQAHHARLHKYADEQSEKEETSAEPKSSRVSRENIRSDHPLHSPASYYGRSSLERQQQDKPAFDLALAKADVEVPTTPLIERAHHKPQATRSRSNSGKSVQREQLRAANQIASQAVGEKQVKWELKRLHDQIQADDYQKFATEFEEGEPESISLRRSKSSLQLRDIETPTAHTSRLPRQLSFSLVEDSVLKFEGPQDGQLQGDFVEADRGVLPAMRVLSREVEEHELQQLIAKLLHIEQNLLLYTESEIIQVVNLEQESREHLEELNNFYYQRLDEYQSLQATSRDLVAREKASLSDGLKKVEMLGQKLDYELDALQSRMQEVEDGAEEFERNVVELEARVAELAHGRQSEVSKQIEKAEDKAIPWLQRAVNLFTPSRK